MDFGKPQGPFRMALAGLLIGIVALIDWRVEAPIAFGFLYLFPVLLVGSVARRWHVVASALVCMALADVFSPIPFSPGVSLPQDVLVFTALAGAGMFSYEAARSRQREREDRQRLEKEVVARRAAEEQLEFLIESSPVAILTMAGDCLIGRANPAAHRLLRVPAGGLPGQSIRRYIPALGRVPFLDQTAQTFRTEMQCRGERGNGEALLANVFFSTYNTAAGPRLAALVVDAAEELRDREETSLEQLMAGSRILVGAVSHEVRNVCGAIGVIYENLARNGALRNNQDFEALGALVETLNRIASLELGQTARNSQVGGIDLTETLNDLRIVLEPYCQEADIEVSWDIPAGLPPVWANPHSLLQVLLNLAKNSQRALAAAETGRIDISAKADGDVVIVRFTDSGPGIPSPEKLFQPFQKGAESTGLGLYLSRAFLRSFQGELRHLPSAAGCSFAIELKVAGAAETGFLKAGKHDAYKTHPA